MLGPRPLSAEDAAAAGRLMPVWLHDHNNHLAVLRMQLGLLERRMGAEQVAQMTAQVERMAEHAALVQDLLREARGLGPGRGSRPLAPIARLAQSRLRQAGIVLRIDGDGDGDGLRWTLAHLLDDLGRLPSGAQAVLELSPRRLVLREGDAAPSPGPGRALARAALAAGGSWEESLGVVTATSPA